MTCQILWTVGRVGCATSEMDMVDGRIHVRGLGAGSCGFDNQNCVTCWILWAVGRVGMVGDWMIGQN